MYGQYENGMIGQQEDDDHTRMGFNHHYYQKQPSLQPFLPLDLSLSTESKHTSSSRYGFYNLYQQPQNSVQFQNHSALPQQQQYLQTQPCSRLTEETYYNVGRGYPIRSFNGNDSYIQGSGYFSSDDGFQRLSSGPPSVSEGHRMTCSESEISSKYGAPFKSEGFVGNAQKQYDHGLNSQGTENFHVNSASSIPKSGSASSVFRKNANHIKKMHRVPSSTQEIPELTKEEFSSIQQMESLPLPTFSLQSKVDLTTGGSSAASIFRNNAAILKKIKKSLPSYDLPPKTNSPQVSSFEKQNLETKGSCEKGFSRYSRLSFDCDQVDKDTHHGINSVFDTNLSILTQIQPPSSPVSSLTDSSGVSSGSCDSNFGIKELLMLPSTYSDLSLFQKKYFPTNDYAENKHINVRLNNYCDDISLKIKTEPKDSDFMETSSCTKVSSCDQESIVQTSKTMLSETSSNQTVSPVKLEKYPNISFEKNTSLCVVCGFKAAGFYCGAFVCEACKKFFMRASKNVEVKYKCLKDGNCTITKLNRIQCQYCRYQKCIKSKMFCPGDDNNRNKEKVNSNISCQVCGAQSSGFHFGALTCEGCKGFFRRMAKERNPNSYICSKGDACIVSLSTRNGCKACRYQKCISVGMSVTCSRIGRQPNAVKHAISLAVKQQKISNISFPSLSSLSPSTTTLSPTSALSPSTTTLSPTSVLSPLTTTLSPKSALSPSTTTLSPSSTSSPSPTKISSTSTLSVVSPSASTVTSTASPTYPAALSLIEKKTWSEDDSMDMTTSVLISKIKEAGEALKPIYTAGDIARNELVGKLTDYKIIWKELMKMFIYHSKCVINFTKKLPGIRSLDIKTQVLLIQLSCYTVILLQLSLDYDVDSKEVNFFNLSKEETKAVLEFFPNFEPVRSHLHHIGTMVQALSLDFTETCLISALLIIHEDNTKLSEREKIGQMQDKISECLRTYEEESYDNGATRYGVLLLRLGEFSLASLQYGQAIVGLETLYPDLEYPQLFTEMMIH